MENTTGYWMEGKHRKDSLLSLSSLEKGFWEVSNIFFFFSVLKAAQSSSHRSSGPEPEAGRKGVRPPARVHDKIHDRVDGDSVLRNSKGADSPVVGVP